MDWEAPADAWYVWAAVTVVSVAVAGIALGLPTGPPPDANRAANTIERTTGSPDATSSAYHHDADEVKVDGKTIAMRNDHGTSHASVTYGVIVPVNGFESLENVTRGATVEDEFERAAADPTTDASAEFVELVDQANDENAGEWQWSAGELTVRTVAVESEQTVSITANASEEVVDFEADEVSLPTEISFTPDGETGGHWEWEVTGRTHAYDLDEFDDDIDDDDGLLDAIEGTCEELLPWICDGDEPIDEVATTTKAGDDFLTLRGQETVELASHIDHRRHDQWAGSYELVVHVEAKHGDVSCYGTIREDDDEVELCRPDERLENRDAQRENWLETEGDRYYVTLVIV